MREVDNLKVSNNNHFLLLPKQKANDVFILDENIEPKAISALKITDFQKKYYLGIGNNTRAVQVVIKCFI